MIYHLYDESESERLRALADMVRRKAPYLMRAGGGAVDGLVHGRESWRIPDAMRAKVVALARQGVDCGEISRRLRISHQAAWRIAREAGAVRERKVISQAQVRRLMASGRTQEEVARELGCTQSTISRHWRRMQMGAAA